jgi:MFS superfamily sulfate permease-like transporter
MTNFFGNLKQDIPAGLIVFLVAVPLCLGIALASGAPLLSGLIAGIVGGLVVSIASGSALGVSGPAAGLVAIVLAAIQELGFETFLVAVVLAGALQVALGFARAGVIGYYFPSSVIRGMLAGIGLIIIFKQIPHALGVDKDWFGDLYFWQNDGENTISAIGSAFNQVTQGALLISAIGLALLVLWERPFMKKIPLFKIVQGPLVVVVLGVILQQVFTGTDWALGSKQMVTIPVFSNLNDVGAQLSFPNFGAIGNPSVWVVAFTLAVVASLETLLCLEATDKMDPEKRLTPANRELKAQGLGNMISGLIGGLPVTQVIVRSSANIQSGGKSKASAFIHGIFLLTAVFMLPTVLNMVPFSALAAILIVVGFKLAKPSVFVEMYKQGAPQFVPFIVTIVAILLTDLLIGIGIGLGVALAMILIRHFRVPFFFHTEEDGAAPGTIHIELTDDTSFLHRAGLLKALKDIQPGTKVIIDGTGAIQIDFDVADLLREFNGEAETRHLSVELIHMDEETMQPLSDRSKLADKHRVELPSIGFPRARTMGTSK